MPKGTSLTVEHLRAARKMFEASEPQSDRIWIPLPQKEIDRLVEEGIIEEGDFMSHETFLKGMAARETREYRTNEERGLAEETP